MAPENGTINCDGVPTVGDTCTVTCNDGFMLRGPATRTCQRSRQRGLHWSDRDEPSCVSEGMQQTVSTTHGVIIYLLSIKDSLWDAMSQVSY